MRYFPVSQDINSDEEVWELTETFGDRSLRVWLEILSIADRNNGLLPGRWERYPSLLAARCKSTTRHLQGICEWISRPLEGNSKAGARQEQGNSKAGASWLHVDSEGVARVRNYPKYHKTRAERRPPPNLTRPNLTKPNHKEEKSASVIDLKFEAFYKAYPKKRNKPAALRAWKKEAALIAPEIIMAALEKHKLSRDWQKDGGRFIPYPATWLNGRCWDDELLGDEFEETMEVALARHNRLMEKAYGKRTNH